MQNLFQDLSKKGPSTKKFHKIIVKAFFINTIDEDCLNPIHMQKCYFHATTDLITEILIRMTIVKLVTLLSYYLRV